MTGYIKHVRPITYRQQRAVECWIRNRRTSKAKALREAGYSEAIVRQPHKVFSSPAVQRELELRGHGIHGVTDNQKPRPETVEIVTQNPKYELPVLTKEQLQELKAKLDAAPDLQLTYINR